MLNPENVPEVAAEEQLARYVLQSKHVRQDKTLRPDAFIPHPYEELSVTRHRGATDSEIWTLGVGVGLKTDKVLYGRADLGTDVCLSRQLRVAAAPVSGNPNHANILGWPADKSSQKTIALELAAAAKYVETPDEFRARRA
jgi:hypothetical protein